MAIREGAWDCPSCGQKRNRGPEKFCGSCGCPRGKDIKFYLPEDSQEVTEEEELKKAKSGPDWNCSFCNGDNPSYKNFCCGCGASKDGAPPREVIEHRTDTARSGGDKSPGLSVKSSGDKSQDIPKTSTAAKSGCLGLLLLFLFLVIMGCCCPFMGKETSLTSTGFKWERTIEIEEIKTIRDTAWEDNVPSDAKIISSKKEVHHHDKVKIGTETKTRIVKEKVKTGTEKIKVGVKDLGNGYFEDIYEERPVYEEVEREETYEEPVYEDKPVYKKKITYTVDRWTVARVVSKTGQDQKPFWPDVKLKSKERKGKRTEKYQVLFTDPKGKALTYTAKNETEWFSFEQGKAYEATVTMGKITEIKK